MIVVAEGDHDQGAAFDLGGYPTAELETAVEAIALARRWLRNVLLTDDAA